MFPFILILLLHVEIRLEQPGDYFIRPDGETLVIRA